MPELPEVESLVRDLSPSLVGRTIQGVEVHKEKLFNAAPGLTVEDLLGVARLRGAACVCTPSLQPLLVG